MSKQDAPTEQVDSPIFSDPVAYLARFGIEAEMVSETALPSAA